jgi:hypothetical protein
MWRTKKYPPCWLKDSPKHKHVFEEVPKDPIESALPWKDSDRYGALYEAYKKHSAELRSIEDGENKLLLLILTIFGAGVTVVSKVDLKEHLFTAGYLTAIVGGLIWVGLHVVHENHDLRIAVRDLLVQCEQAMQFYTPNIFLKGRPLYQDAERHYACKGYGLQNFSWLVISAAAAFLMVLIWYNFFFGPIKT